MATLSDGALRFLSLCALPPGSVAVANGSRLRSSTVPSFDEFATDPLVSVCANGPLAASITAEHALEFCESRGTPFEKLYTLGAHTILLGVGFNRCTSLHYAESLVPGRRTMMNRVLPVG